MATTSTATKKIPSKKTSETTSSKTVSNVDQKTIQELQTENQELKAKMDELIALVSQQTENTTSSTIETKFTPEDEITVISLVPHKLNLATEKYGQGNVYEFSSMYEEQDIPWSDLKDIVRNNRKMAQNGKFYILNDAAVGYLRLRTTYKNILNPDQFKSMMLNDSVNVVELYKLAPQGQKTIIVEMLKDKKLNHEDVDMNVLHTIGDLAGIDLVNLENPDDIPVKDEK